MNRNWVLPLVMSSAAACASSPAARPAVPQPETGSAGPTSASEWLFARADAFPSTYAPPASRATLIRNATILTAAGPRIENGSVLLQNGRIAAVGANVNAPADAIVIDGAGKWVTPGIIDTHSHLGVYAAPGIESLADGNEMTNPNTAEVWAEHSVWPHDPQFGLAVAGGITTLQVLPGSANLFGGRSVTLKNVESRTMQGMKFPDAPYGLKMACGENPRRVYASRGPATRMGNVAGFRAAWIRASRYRDQWTRWRDAGSDVATRPDRDLGLETLAGVLEGEILVHNHCYRGDEMAVMIDIANEFGYSIASFHHGVEAYKVRDLLRENDICGSLWADWWGFKLEAYDGILENIALLEDAGACAIVHSDDPQGIQRLNHEAAKAMAAGNRGGLDITYEHAIRWITANPARALGLADRIGTLEPGRNADVVLWTGDPFSIYTKAERVWIDGALQYDLNDPATHRTSDFSLGRMNREVTR
jgi:imidazolonepropionase-like amidohydrolase